MNQSDKTIQRIPNAKLSLRISLIFIMVVAIAFLFLYGYFIWPDEAINRFSPELDKLNYEIYSDLSVPQNTTLTEVNFQSDDMRFFHEYLRRISAFYETTLSQDEILNFYRSQLESQGWKHYAQRIFRDNQGNEYFRHDDFRRGISCIHLGTGDAVAPNGKNDYLLEISHDFWSQRSSPPKIVFDILKFRFEDIYFEKCPR